MTKNVFAPDFDALPKVLPVFPLEGVLLLPCGRLPLNIFEPRYLAMVEAALGTDRLIGMIQPDQGGALYKTGCAGKITEFSETEDGRYLITLSGVSRFHVMEELDGVDGYRRVKPSWLAFEKDLDAQTCSDLDRDRLKALLQKYFQKQDMDCDWDKIEGAPDGKLITCLSMVCPFDPQEKQALLEAPCCNTRADMFLTMLEMAVCADIGCTSQH